ncbi:MULTISPECIES: hypothetical protein [Amycolatopsis]|uniref:Uncharacterized protein n=1 Tax=Amycolatopsis bullii TaxID=941987 RepID=A0ABQ3KIF9_9PSEU|nr:hypothetical protein [Amycolatopsis bullii]GHG26509.1 hypothetical protein GCM10017567_52200 [Amycolatopsis bullii]
MTDGLDDTWGRLILKGRQDLGDERRATGGSSGVPCSDFTVSTSGTVREAVRAIRKVFEDLHGEQFRYIPVLASIQPSQGAELRKQGYDRNFHGRLFGHFAPFWTPSSADTCVRADRSANIEAFPSVRCRTGGERPASSATSRRAWDFDVSDFTESIVAPGT